MTASLQVGTGHELRRKAASGALWNYGSLAWTKVAALIVSVVLARTLTPAEFGIVAIAFVIVTYLDVINNFGIASAVVYEEDDDQQAMSTAFWLSQGFGFLAFLITAATAPLTARLFDMPELAPIQAVLGFSFVLGSLGSIHDARLRRSLRWRQRMPADLTRSTTKSVGTVILALAGLGAWSLVWSQLAAVLIFSLLIMVAFKWRPSFTWSAAAARRQLSFGGHYSASLALGSVAKDLDYVLVGAILTPAALGWYTMGFRLPDLAIMGITWAASQTAFPVFVRLRAEMQGLQGAVVYSQRLLAIVTMPLAAALAVASVPIVGVLFGPDWAPTAAVMPFIAIAAGLKALTFVGGDALKATGRVRVLTVVALIRLPITVIVMLAVVPRGIVAVAVAQLLLSLAAFVVDIALIKWFTGPSVRRMLGAFVPALVGSCALALTFVVVASLGWPDSTTLIVGLGLGFAVYAGIVWRLERTLLSELRGLLQPTRVQGVSS